MGGLCTKCNDECVPLMDSTSPRYHACGRSGDQDIEMREEVVFDACCNCGPNGDCSDCKCSTHRCTFCQSQNCLFRKQIQDAIDSMRTEQTRDALNELMAVQGIAKLNEAVFGPEFQQVHLIMACTECHSSQMYVSKCCNVDCGYREELEKAIQRMDADKGKTALKEVLNSNSLNKVEDAVFWNVCNDMVPKWYDKKNKHIQDENEFKHNANDFAHFAVDRKGKYKHHFFTLRPNSETVTIVQYSDALFNHFFGIGEVQSANFKFTEQELNSVVDFKGERCFRIRHNENSLKTEMERYGRMIGKMEERFYNVHFNNCEHFVNYVLDGKVSAPMTNEQRKKATFWDIILSELKSVGLLVTFVIALAGITLGSIERQSYVRIFIAALISFERQDNLDVCTSHIGKHIIQNARDRLEIDMYKDPETFDGDLIKNMSRYLDSPLVCDKAQQLGYRVLFKSSIYFLLVGFMLQTAIILTYNYMHLKPMRRMCLQQRKLYLYRKYLYREVFGGYAPILFTVTYGGVLQYMSSLPPTAHYLALCLFAVICRFIVLTIIECIFCKFRGRLDKVLATIIIIFLIIIFIICIFFHYYAHAKLDPF